MGFISILLIDVFFIWLVIKGISWLVRKVRELNPNSRSDVSEEDKQDEETNV